MTQSYEQRVAKILLETRDHGGFSYELFYTRIFKSYLIQICFFIPCLTLLYYMDFWFPFFMVFGMIIGSYLRDMAWVRTSIKNWPITATITDWDKVQRMADGETVV